jgi:hypothetical protein
LDPWEIIGSKIPPGALAFEDLRGLVERAVGYFCWAGDRLGDTA